MTVKNYILGNVKVTKWSEEGKGDSFSLEKSYKDDKGEWQTTKSFRLHELTALSKVIEEVIAKEIKEV